MPTRLTIADADEYYEIGHYTHEDIYIYDEDRKRFPLLGAPVSEKNPHFIKRACWRWDPL